MAMDQLLQALYQIQKVEAEEQRIERSEERDMMKFFTEMNLKEEQWQKEKEWRIAERRNDLESKFGTRNVTIDEKGFPTLVSDDKFDVTHTPEYEIWELTHAAESKKDMEMLSIDNLTKEYWALYEERSDIADDIQEKHTSINDEHISSNFSDVSNMLDGVAEGNLTLLSDKISTLQSNVKALDALKLFLNSQEGFYSENSNQYVDFNTVIDPHEFELMIQDYQEKFPGKPIAGLKSAYLKNKPSDTERLELTLNLTDKYKEPIMSDYQIMQGTIATANDSELDDEDKFDMEGAIVEIFPEMVEEDQIKLAEMINRGLSTTDVTVFHEYVINEPTGKVREFFEARFPVIWDNIDEGNKNIRQLNLEYEAGNSGLLAEDYIDTAVVNLETYLKENFNTEQNWTTDTPKDIKLAFNEYENIIEFMPDIEDQKRAFAALESYFNKDLTNYYMQYHGIDVDEFDPSSLQDPDDPGLYGDIDDILYAKDMDGNYLFANESGQISGKKIYTMLNRVANPDKIPALHTDYNVNYSSRIARGTQLPGLDASSERVHYTLASALTGSWNENQFMNNNFDTAVYDNLRNLLKQQVESDDPMGLNRSQYGEFFVDDAALVQKIEQLYPDKLQDWIIQSISYGEKAKIDDFDKIVTDGLKAIKSGKVADEKFYNILNSLQFFADNEKKYTTGDVGDNIPNSFLHDDTYTYTDSDEAMYLFMSWDEYDERFNYPYKTKK
tara:strand:+ start:651 stop:2828 length:2178 start_codon:yes stop_codon:yes gene_type:complete